MGKIEVRRATMDDVMAISTLFRGRIAVWQRLNSAGQVEDLAYEALTIYERWLHGGAWMSVETASLHLSHVLVGAGIPVVASVDGQVRAYAEFYLGDEPAPFGRHLHLAQLVVHPLHQANHRLENVLLRYISEQGLQMDVERLTVSFSGYDADAADYYRQYGMHALDEVGRYAITAQTGQGFYKVTAHDNPDPAQIAGFTMTVGRTESARCHWETLWVNLWGAFPKINARRTFRLKFNVAGQEVFLVCREDLYNPRAVDLFCWSPKPLTGQVMVAIRDWAHRQGYRTLHLNMTAAALKALNLEAESIPFKQAIYAVDLVAEEE